MSLPINQFLRPVGNYGYCLKLLRVVAEKWADQWQFERWGMKEKKPFNDGHKSKWYMRNIVQIAPGIFKITGQLCCGEPRYFRLIQDQPSGQLDLFGGAA